MYQILFAWLIYINLNMSEQSGSSLEEIVRIVQQQFQKNVKKRYLCKEEEEGEALINNQFDGKISQPQVLQYDKMQCQTESGLQNQYESFLPLQRLQTKEQNSNNKSKKLQQKPDNADYQQRKLQQSVQEKELGKIIKEGQQLQVELSVEDSQSEEDEGYSNEYSMGKGKSKSKKTKRIKKKVIKNRSGLDEDSILLERKRKRKYGSTYKEVEPKQLRRHNKIEHDSILKDTTRNHHLQNILVRKIVYSLLNGQSRYYLVELVNSEQVYISQNHMRIYFPRKLGQFYERLLNKLAIRQQSIQ